jgi:type II secretory pathway component PulM
MAFEDLRDQFSERAQAVWGRVQESSVYIQLSEKYADLNPTSQKIVAVVAILLVSLFTLMIPWSYISSSNTSLALFEENKALLRELYRVSRASSELQGAPPQIDPGQLQGRAQGQLTSMGLQAEQVGGVTIIDNAQPGGPQLPGVPKAVQQKGIEVTLKKLNLRQIIEVGYQMMTIQPGLKMTGLTVTASAPDPHYFDAVYRIISFSLPGPPPEAKPAPGKGRAAPKRARPADDEAEEDAGEDE